MVDKTKRAGEKKPYMAAVAEGNGFNDLSEDSASILSLHAAMADQIVKQLATGGVLHDQHQLSRGVNDLVQPGDVWVVQRLEDVHLTHKLLSISRRDLYNSKERRKKKEEKKKKKKKKP